MAQSGSSKRRAQGGGRTPNSEPKLQVFKEFNGVNFEHSNVWNTVPDIPTYDSDQTDQPMNYVFLQNNVATASNKTMETRDDIVTFFQSDADIESTIEFTGPTCLIGNKLYIAMNDGNIGVADLNEATGIPIVDTMVTLDNKTGSTHTWTSLNYYDDKLIALTEENEIWTGDVASDYSVAVLANAAEIPNPTTDLDGHLIGMGSLVLSLTATDECPFRMQLAFTYVNKYGPTLPSQNTVFYMNHPMSEWHAGCFLRIYDNVPQNQDILAVELYYATDNAMEMLFLGRVDVYGSTNIWQYDSYGYVDATSMWPTANLIIPTKNYTKGVHASRVTNIDGRMYFWGDVDEPQRLYIGGNPGNLLSISPGTGGGFVDVEPGTNQAVRYVCKYKTQSGNSIVTMLCDSPNTQREQRFNLVENSISLSNEQSMKSWQAEQVAGAVGCKSYYGAVVCADGIYSVSRYGVALTTMTMEYNSQIRTNYVSDQIKPVFTDVADKDVRLSNSMLLECDGILYMAMGAGADQYGNLDNVVFCYDIDLKAWWTYTLEVEEPILGMFHVDWQGQRNGIGIVTNRYVHMLPTTRPDASGVYNTYDFLIQTSQLATQMPQQGWQYLSQLEFHFDYLQGDILIEVRMIDMFGREITINKLIEEDQELFDHTVHMRIDQRVMSYVITLTGKARFRLTHWIARVYTLSNKIGQVWGFDDWISHRSSADVQQRFRSYNDVRKAIFT